MSEVLTLDISHIVTIVSNKEGNELGSKLRDYAQIGVTYYVVVDPDRLEET